MNSQLYELKDNFIRYKSVKSKLIYGSLSHIEKPLITIAIPTFKRGKYLKEALDSAVSQCKDVCDFEIIIVDNDNSDGVLELLQSYNEKDILYYQNESNIGMFGNWNRCVELARGEWISFLHDDDLLQEGYLSTIVQLIKSKNDIGAIIANYSVIDSDSAVISHSRDSKLKRRLKYYIERKMIKLSPRECVLWNSNIYNTPSCGTILKRKYVQDIGGFNEEFFPSADWFFFYEFNRLYKVYKSIGKIGCYRIADNESAKNETLEKFIEYDHYFRERVNQSSQFGKTIKSLWYDVQTLESLEWMSKLCHKDSEIPVKFIEAKRNTNRFKWFIYKKFRKLHDSSKIVFYLIFG